LSPQPADDDRCTPILRERIRALFRHLPKALVGEADAIHDLRVAGRRLRAALPLLATKPRGRRVRRASALLGQLTRGAGSSRDLDVSLALLDERLHDIGRTSDELRTLRRRLRAARSRMRGRMADAVLDLEIATLRRDLRAIVARGSERLFTVLLRFRDARDRQAEKLLSEMEAAGERFDAEGLHRLRIRCRRLRYLGELAGSLKGQPSEAAAIGIFKQLQDRLGEIHDVHVLAVWLEAQAGAARRRGLLGLADEAAAQQAWFLERSRSLHREYLAALPIEMATRGIQALGGTRSAA